MEISKRIRNLFEKFLERSGTYSHPDKEISNRSLESLENSWKHRDSPILIDIRGSFEAMPCHELAGVHST